jgi:hypothetical protein
MSRQYAWWLGALLLGVAWLESCGAMTIETAPPDEPVVRPPPAPRLVRSDAGVEAGEKP